MKITAPVVLVILTVAAVVAIIGGVWLLVGTGWSLIVAGLFGLGIVGLLYDPERLRDGGRKRR